MKKKIIFFYPEILDDGLLTTCKFYIKHFRKKFDISVIYFRKDKKYKFLSNIKTINVKNKIFDLITIVKKNEKNTIFFSLDKHYYLLILKILNYKFKSIVRIPNPLNYKKNFFLSKNSGEVLSIFEIFFLSFSNKVLTYSKKSSNYFKNIYQFKNIELIRNYFPKKKYNIKKNKKKIKNVFFIGRLVKGKDPKFFLEGCNIVKKIRKFNINIVGEGPYKKELVQFSRLNNLDVKFHGFVPKPFEFFKNKIDLFCLTSQYDGTPNVLGEAISYGIPCLAPRDVGACDELLINGKGGYLYSPNQLASFKKKLYNILNNPESARLKAVKSYRNLSLFDKKNTLDKLHKVINKLFLKKFY